MTYRFVHAADVHLDSPLRSLAFRDEELAELIGNASRRAFISIVDLCLRERVDALMLSGDLYDGDQTSMKTALFLAGQVRRLHEAGVRVFVVRGNHDALSTITRELTFPASVHVFGGSADAVEFDHAAGGLRIAVHGLSFVRPHAPGSLLPDYRPPVDGAVNVGLMHTSLGGHLDHDPYAPCSVEDLHASGIQYWALGHVHRREVIRGASVIVMPGMPQGRDVGEAGSKSVSLVTVMDDRSIRISEEMTSVAQFERVTVDLGGHEDWREVVSILADALRDERERTASEHLVARITLTGTTPLAWRLLRDGDLLRTEAEDCARRLGACWIDKVEVACRVGHATAGPGAGVGPIGELQRLMADEVLKSNAYVSEAAEILDDMAAHLPPECRDLLGTDEGARARMAAALSGEGVRDVLARLHGSSEGDR